MRTYSYLIRYESEFTIAIEKGLIPHLDSGKDEITWDSFAQLIGCFDRYGDDSVSPRYSYGELRLTRLNFYSRIFLRKLTFHHVDAQWGSFISHAITPFIVVFAILALALNAMQVELAVQGNEHLESTWATFASISKWTAVIILFFVLGAIVFLIMLISIMFFHDI